MANPRIVFNAINLDFPEVVETLSVRRVAGGGRSLSDGGVTERVRTSIADALEIGMGFHGSASFHNALTAWWAWASRGKQYSFALDSAKTVNTTLVNNESAGATVIELTSTSGVTAGQNYLMRSADLLSEEIVNVASVGGGAATLSAGTKYAYTAADVFRDPLYWPKLTSVDDEAPFMELAGLIYQFAHRCVEDRG